MAPSSVTAQVAKTRHKSLSLSVTPLEEIADMTDRRTLEMGSNVNTQGSSCNPQTMSNSRPTSSVDMELHSPWHSSPLPPPPIRPVTGERCQRVLFVKSVISPRRLPSACNRPHRHSLAVSSSVVKERVKVVITLTQTVSHSKPVEALQLPPLQYRLLSIRTVTGLEHDRQPVKSRNISFAGAADLAERGYSAL